ncbi:unnamed protein product [Mycena citricolor]|uniref:Uncharacterized protein n=1 Tax=Mycena citricolor TaxID=2018698 RepID=A0AAD2HGX9_9AGAR|nr:unnamed protein product [Mycena citricolor]CAK5275632.1 unnamed protein product [Mycena citricolor]
MATGTTSSNPLFSSTSLGNVGSVPSTPVQGHSSRTAGSEFNSQPVGSPTSTLSGLGDSTSRPIFRSSFVQSMQAPGTPLRPQNKIIRSDPSLLTAFDPADRELYDLWAPKH